MPIMPITQKLNATLSLPTALSRAVTQLENDINRLLDAVKLPSPLSDACHYAMTGSGKRVRPMLVAAAFLSLCPERSLSPMCRRAMLAVELIHAYSLLHDDLPCMDDDALRRGRPTCHIVYGEATALLAGDVLQTLAFEVLSCDALIVSQTNHTADGRAHEDQQTDLNHSHLSSQLIATLAPNARRMVAGQMLDLNGEQQPLNQSQLETIHREKTAALIEAAVVMGGLCAEASTPQLQALTEFARHLGLAFQVQDDILDVTADTEQLGKPAGSDEKLDKATYVKLMGTAAAQTYAKHLFNQSRQSISHVLGENVLLIQLADWLWQRQR